MTLPPSLKRGSSDNEEFVRQQRRKVDFDNILVIDAEDIELESTEPINVAGHFSDLFVGYYRRRAKVALKRPRTARNGNMRDVIQRFEEEAHVWKILRHPHILEFIGIYKSEEHMYLVSPFIENGTLKEYIDANPDAARPKFLCETADALAYLHAMGIIHGDVKASNILISSDLRALICDFGLAKWMPTITASQSKGAGTVRWQSPELWNGASRCFASDVYAFGITVAEVLSGETPFSELEFDGAVIMAVSSDGLRPQPIPSHSPTGESYQHIWSVASRCWKTEPGSRPMMKDVLDCLQAPASVTVERERLDIGSPSDEPVNPSSLLSDSVVAVSSPEPLHVLIEDTEWITFTTTLGRTPGKFQPAKATNQAYGAFSDVKKCELIYEDGGSETAALKRLRPVRLGTQAEDAVDIDRERFEREILVWAGIWHCNVAPLLGFTLSPDFYLISPWYPNGTIRQYIATHPGCNRLNLIQDVASGLGYLHTCQPPIVHGDIKSNNVVVDADGHAKIIDFGLSQILEHSTTEANTVIEVGNSRWMAPEVLTSQQITCASDVYSFGCLALETASNLPPFRTLQQGLRQIVTRPTSLKPVTDRSAYSRIPEDSPLWDLLFSCWENDPGKRPSMTDLGTQLRGLISSRVSLGRSPRSSPSSSGSGSSRSQAPTQVDSPSNLLLSIRPTGNPSSEWSAFFQKSGLPAGRYRRLNSQMLGCGVLSDSWLCEMERDGEVQQVAAKELRFTRESTDMFRRALEGLERDARTWMAFKHPNIVPVLGYTFERTFLLLRHWCPNGNIRDYLKRQPECDKSRLMRDAACGLSYIHAQDIVHGNIRPENVLIDAEGQARIVDCGISKVAEEMPTFHTSMVKIDCRWIAPELALGDQRYQMSSSSDVYSLGCLAILVLADREPYEDYRTNRGVTEAMTRGEEPANQDTLWPEEKVGGMWTACWKRDPEVRPTAWDLKARIETMLR